MKKEIEKPRAFFPPKNGIVIDIPMRELRSDSQIKSRNGKNRTRINADIADFNTDSNLDKSR